MADDALEILSRNLTIDNALDAICKLEDTRQLSSETDLVKWKSYQHQVVVQSSSFFYKVYEEETSGVGPFYSLVRKALAQVYSGLGLHWELVSFERDGKIYDFEQREELPVATRSDASFAEILLSMSGIYDAVENALEFDDILQQIKANFKFSEVSALKLVRYCVNKHEDYAMFEGRGILLDDADFYIATVNEQGDVVVVDPEEEVRVRTSYGNFVFSSYMDFHEDAGKTRHLPEHNCVMHGWFLLKEPAKFEATSQIVKAQTSTALAENAHITQRKLMEKKVASLANVIELTGKEEFELCYEDVPQNTKKGSAMAFKEEGPTAEELLYSNNMGKKSYQWELWQCCNNLCKFCYLGMDNRHTDKERQLKSLQDLLKSLDVLDFNVYNNVSLIGGEFFQGQLEDEEVSSLFFQVIEKIAQLYVDKKIGSVWVTATLTIGDQADLYKMLDIFERAGVKPHPNYGASGVWICTSWDAQGRFHTEKLRKNWEFHMRNIKTYYPWVKKNTTIICTQKLCEMYLAGEYSPKEFMQKFDTQLFYKQPGFYETSIAKTGDLMSVIDAYNAGRLDEFLTSLKEGINEDVGCQFFPDRKIFRKFLLKYAKEDADTYERLFNIRFRADELHRNFNERYKDDAVERDKNSNFETSTRSESLVNTHCKEQPDDAKHIINYATYNDCNECMMCDKIQIWKSVHGEEPLY